MDTVSDISPVKQFEMNEAKRYRCRWMIPIIIVVLLLIGVIVFIAVYFGVLQKDDISSNYKVKNHYPKVLRFRKFIGNQGYDWTYSADFSPVDHDKVYIVIGHTDNFILEYYVNNFTLGIQNMNYVCSKYEAFNESTIFIRVFETLSLTYIDPIPDMCTVCTGVLAREHTLTDTSLGVPISSEPPPPMTEPTKPPFC